MNNAEKIFLNEAITKFGSYLAKHYGYYSLAEYVDIQIEKHPEWEKYRSSLISGFINDFEDQIEEKKRNIIFSDIPGVEHELKVIAPQPEEETRRYTVSDFPNLYMELNKADLNNPMNFIKKFGLPLPGRHIPLDYKDGNSALDPKYFMFNFFTIVKADLKEYKLAFEEFLKLLKNKNHPNNGFLHKYTFHIGKHTVNISLVFDKNGKIKPAVKATSLFDIAYFQMMSALTREAEIKKCHYCGHYFEVTHENQKFCPRIPTNTSKRSSCEMAFNNRQKKALKLYREGKTINEIDKLVNIPIEDIKEFIQRREGDQK